MLEGVGAAAVGCGRGRGGPHPPDWLDRPRAGLEGEGIWLMNRFTELELYNTCI